MVAPSLLYLADIAPTAVRVYRPLWYHLRGLSQTASGYGARLTSAYCVRFSDGILRRIYVTQYSNAGTAWIMLAGKRVIVDDRIARAEE